MCQATENLRRLLRTTFRDFRDAYLPPQTTLTFDETTAVRDALIGMKQNHTRSCIVLPSGDGSFHTMDMRDVLKYLVKRYDEAFAAPVDGSSRESDVTSSRRRSLTEAGFQFLESIAEEPIGNVAGFAMSEDTNCICTPDVTLEEILRRLESTPRLLVVEDGAEGVMRVLSVSDIFSIFRAAGFLDAANVELNDPSLASTSFQRVLSLPCQAIDVKTHHAKLYSCWESEPLVAVAHRMADLGVSALPVLDANPELLVDRRHSINCLGVISMSDLKLLLVSPRAVVRPVAPLTTPVLTYLSTITQLENLKSRFPVISVGKNSPVREALSKMSAAGIHRVMLTENAPPGRSGRVVTGVLTITDIARRLAGEVDGDRP